MNSHIQMIILVKKFAHLIVLEEGDTMLSYELSVKIRYVRTYRSYDFYNIIILIISTNKIIKVKFVDSFDGTTYVDGINMIILIRKKWNQ